MGLSVTVCGYLGEQSYGYIVCRRSDFGGWAVVAGSCFGMRVFEYRYQLGLPAGHSTLYLLVTIEVGWAYYAPLRQYEGGEAGRRL